MTRAEARAWITDNRAGFGFSGPLADLPNTEAMDPLADAGEIDRRTALGLIFDPELDNPENGAASLAKIENALGAEDIRFNDRASAYRRLWCLAADGLVEVSGLSLAHAFSELVRQTEPRLDFAEDETAVLDTYLAAIEGLDRALRGNVPQGTFDDELCRRIADNARKLAIGAVDNVFAPLGEILLGRARAGELLARFDVRCQIGIVACLSAQKTGPIRVDFQFAALESILRPDAADSVPLPDGLRMSLLKFDRSYNASISSLVVSRGQSSGAAISRLNRTLVQLQRVAAYGDGEEPAPFSVGDGIEPNAVVRLADAILGIWSPSGASTPNESAEASGIELDAAATLVNVTYAAFGSIASQRPRFMRLIAGSSGAMPLPSPPGLKTSGIMLWCGNGRLLLASAEALDFAPVGVNWTDKGQQPISGIRLLEAALPEGCSLLVEESRTWEPSQIATLYRTAFPIFHGQLGADAERVPVPTAFSFFANISDGQIDFSTLKLVCWSAARSSVDGHAFVRMGAALEARSIFADGADLWRLGWAVRDACNRAELMLDDEAGLDQHATTALEKDFHRRDAIVTRVLPRLSGADRWGPGDGTPENPIPTRIARALLLLENFDRADTVSSAASYLIAAVTEGMFMSERVNALEDINSPGRPAALMVRSARRVSRALPEAAKHWPTLQPTSLPFRRSAAAWQMLSLKIGRSADEVVKSAAEALNALQVATEALATIADLRSLAFDLMASLPDESIELLASAKFDLAWVSEIVGIDLVMLDTGTPTSDPSLSTQTEHVVRAFCQVVQGQRGGLNYVRDQIMPSGWCPSSEHLAQLAA